MKTQTLIFTIFFLLIVGILAAALVGMWRGQTQVSIYQRHAITAFYLACAGAERAKVEVLDDVSLSGWCPSDNPDDWYTDLDIPGDNLRFRRYKFRVEIVKTPSGLPTDRRRIRGVGEVLDANSNILTHREITLTVEGVGDIIPPHDGKDDDFSAEVVDGTWQEI